MIEPGATIGILGGGQLGQMIGQSAVEMGFRVLVLDPTPGCSASRVAEQIVAPYDDVAAVRELAERSDVVTYEFENVDAEALAAVGLPTRALRICQDRWAEKQFLTEAGVPVAPFRLVNEPEDLVGPGVLKTRRGGYDGKGQVVLGAEGTEQEAWAAARELIGATECILEDWVDFELELSVIVAGNGTGQFVTFPPSENQHRRNILHRSIVPARVPPAAARQAEELALTIAKHLDLVGVMGVELFYLPGGELLVNELAPRPHNSGHYTIEACSLSQFDAHVRGICGWPLPTPRLLSPAVMTNVLGEDLPATLERIRTEPTWSVHLYGKGEARPGRKMGHITVLEETP